jgi:hypothetical protein
MLAGELSLRVLHDHQLYQRAFAKIKLESYHRCCASAPIHNGLFPLSY